MDVLSYRNLTEDDCGFILKHWVGRSVVFKEGLCESGLRNMIRSINTGKHDGNYYEMFGVLCGSVLVGTFSLYQRECDIPENAVYMSIEISAENRRKGFAANAVSMAFELAKQKGYKKVFSQTRADNIAGVNLHGKCGFKVVEKTLSKKGHEVYNYAYVL
jgi:L-amino acid N-acyltransferase YncA